MAAAEAREEVLLANHEEKSSEVAAALQAQLKASEAAAEVQKEKAAVAVVEVRGTLKAAKAQARRDAAHAQKILGAVTEDAAADSVVQVRRHLAVARIGRHWIDRRMLSAMRRVVDAGATAKKRSEERGRDLTRQSNQMAKVVSRLARAQQLRAAGSEHLVSLSLARKGSCVQARAFRSWYLHVHTRTIMQLRLRAYSSRTRQRALIMSMTAWKAQCAPLGSFPLVK